MWMYLGGSPEAIDIGDNTIVLTSRMVFDAPTHVVTSLIRRGLVVYVDRDRPRGQTQRHRGRARLGIALGLKIRVR